MPGGQQQRGHPGELLVVELATGDQLAEQVLAGLGSLAPDQLGEVAHQLRARGAPLLDGVVEVHRLRCSVLEARTLAVRHAKQLADHQRRDRQRERLDQVRRRARAGHLIELTVDDLLGPGLQPAHLPHAEVPGQQPAISGVLRVVHRDEEARRDHQIRQPLGRHQLLDRRRGALRGVAEVRVVEHRAGLGVTGDQPAEPPVGVDHRVQRSVELSQYGRRLERVLPLERQRPKGFHTSQKSA